MAKSNQLKQLKSTWWGRTLMSLVFLSLAYGVASLAIDSGSLFEYALTLILLVLAFKNAVHAVRHRQTLK